MKPIQLQGREIFFFFGAHSAIQRLRADFVALSTLSVVVKLVKNCLQ